MAERGEIGRHGVNITLEDGPSSGKEETLVKGAEDLQLGLWMVAITLIWWRSARLRMALMTS